MGYEKTTDRYIPEDDNPEQALLFAEFARQALREANEQGDILPEDKTKLEFQDKQIALLERLTTTADAEGQDEIRRQLRDLEAEHPEVMATAFAILPVNLEREPQKGMFKGHKRGHAGQW